MGHLAQPRPPTSSTMVHDHTHSHTSPGHSHAHGPAPEAEDMEVETDADAPSESAHQATVIACFDTYLLKALSSNQRRRADFYCLSEAHRALLPGYNDLLKQVSSTDERMQAGVLFIEVSRSMRSSRSTLSSSRT
mgnify:CR=1 FL=1